jgi:hypothetical protein
MANLKDMRALVREAQRAGCLAERLRNGHTRLTAPNGARIDLSFSPGSAQAVRSEQTKVRKFLAANMEVETT